MSPLRQYPQCAFEAIPTNDRHANSAWQMLCVLGLNLVRSFQIQLGAPRRPRSRKRTYAYFLRSLKTLRFELIHQRARIVQLNGKRRLRYAVSPPRGDDLRPLSSASPKPPDLATLPE